MNILIHDIHSDFNILLHEAFIGIFPFNLNDYNSTEKFCNKMLSLLPPTHQIKVVPLWPLFPLAASSFHYEVRKSTFTHVSKHKKSTHFYF